MTGFTLGQPFGHGRSFQQVVFGAAPGAGNAFSLKADARYTQRLVSCVFTFTASAAAANRYVTVEARDDAGRTLWASGAAQIVTAGLARRFVGTLNRGTDSFVAGSDIFFPLAPCFLRSGMLLVIAVAAIDVGDTLTGIVLVFDQYPYSHEQLPSGPD